MIASQLGIFDGPVSLYLEGIHSQDFGDRKFNLLAPRAGRDLGLQVAPRMLAEILPNSTDVHMAFL